MDGEISVVDARQTAETARGGTALALRWLLGRAKDVGREAQVRHLRSLEALNSDVQAALRNALQSNGVSAMKFELVRGRGRPRGRAREVAVGARDAFQEAIGLSREALVLRSNGLIDQGLRNLLADLIEVGRLVLVHRRPGRPRNSVRDALETLHLAKSIKDRIAGGEKVEAGVTAAAELAGRRRSSGFAALRRLNARGSLSTSSTGLEFRSQNK
jgi:hypothetical protein